MSITPKAKAILEEAKQLEKAGDLAFEEILSKLRPSALVGDRGITHNTKRNHWGWE